ncbi:hypothetical protein [Actinoplanes sp. NPDC051411]|uniref:hypothetical protein n=1 Tax=Actinoplanes sp. NPDC051411 TaxID=3155522 RepID=UPI0034251729
MTTMRPRGGLSNVGLGVVIGVAVALTLGLLGLLAIPVFGFFAWWRLGPDVDDAKAAADHYLARLEARDDAGAYALLCGDARHATTRDAFTDLVDAGPRPASHTVADGSFADEAGHHADVVAYLADRSGPRRRLELTLTYADRKWSVCGADLI